MLVTGLAEQAPRPKRIGPLALPLATFGDPLIAGVRFLENGKVTSKKQLSRIPPITKFSVVFFLILLSTSCHSSELIEYLVSSPQMKIFPIEESGRWSQISNDNKIPIFTRRKAIFCLLQRHVKIGMKLSEIADKLKIANWLNFYDVNQITNELINFPVDPDSLLNGSIFSIVVLPRKFPGLTVTFVFNKAISSQDFYKKIKCQPTDNSIDPELVQMYFWGYEFSVDKYDSKEPPDL